MEQTMNEIIADIPNEKYRYLEAVSKSLSSYQLGLEVRGFKDLVIVLGATKVLINDLLEANE